MKNTIYFVLGLTIAILIGCNTPNAGKSLQPIKPDFKNGSLIAKIETHEVPHFTKTLPAGTERDAREALTNKYAELELRDTLEKLKKTKPSAAIPTLPPLPPAFIDTPEYTNRMLALEAEILKRAKKSKDEVKDEANLTVSKEGFITLLPAPKVDVEVPAVKEKLTISKLALYYAIIAALGMLGWFSYRYVKKIKAKSTPTTS